MRAFLHIFMRLFVPITLLVAILLTLFFSFEYSFNKAMSLGVLYGLLAGITITIISSITLLILRRSTSNVQNKQKEKNIQVNEEVQKVESSRDKSAIETIKKSNAVTTMEHKFMLLMNKELTFELILLALKKQFPHSLTTQDIPKGTIDVKTNSCLLSFSIVPLTKHTSQVTINDISNAKYIQHIISFMKEKEHSFLQY